MLKTNLRCIAALPLIGGSLLVMLCCQGCPAPWADREQVLIEALRTQEERDRGDFVIEGDEIIFERRHVARYNVIEDTIDGERIFIYHGKKDGDAYFAVLSGQCRACGSLIGYDVNRRDFRCSFCGSRYDQDGKPTYGPAKARLESWDVEIVDNQYLKIKLKKDPKYTTEAPGKRT
jgi:Rieske Fe-S protein